MFFCSFASAALREDLYAVSVNGEEVSDGVIVLRHGDSFLISGDNLKSWRFVLPAKGGVEHKGRAYFRLDSFPGVKVEIDRGKQELDITAPVSLFETALINEKRQHAAAPVPGRGLFLNYDLSLEGGADTANSLSGLFEAGVFNRFGAGTCSFLADKTGGGGRITRLETTWFKDDVKRLRTYRIGDGVSRPGSMGDSVRFGGAQMATNFSIDPGFVTYPPLSVGGLAEIPTTVDVLVNNVRSLSEKVPAGPFELLNVPVVSGRGDIQLVVKDLLGREHVITQPYYFSPSLLKKGLSDYSYEAGFERGNYGLRSNDYGRFMAAGTHRYGFTDVFTGEGHTELSADRQFVSAAGVLLAPSLGVFSAGAAAAHDGGWGGAGQAGYEYSGRAFNFGLNVKMATRSGQGGPDTRDLLRQQVQAHAGFSAGKPGSFGLSYTLQKFFQSGDARIFTANYSIRLGPGNLGVSFIDLNNSGSSYTVTVLYVFSFGDNKSILAETSFEKESSKSSMEFQQGPTASIPDYSYRLQAEAGKSDQRFQGEVTREGEFNNADLELSNLSGGTSYRAGISGGLAYLKEGLFASRSLNQSFALASAGGFPGVRVYVNNRESGRTNSKGFILLPGLNPYMENTLRLEESDLPIDAKIGSVKKTVVPCYRSGLSVRFDVKASRDAIITVITPDGKPLPAGTSLKGPNGLSWLVAKHGEVYLTDLGEGKTSFSAHYRDRTCRVKINIPHDLKGIPELGTFVCEQAPQAAPVQSSGR